MVIALLVLIVLILLFGAEDILSLIWGLITLAFWAAVIGGGILLFAAL